MKGYSSDLAPDVAGDGIGNETLFINILKIINKIANLRVIFLNKYMVLGHLKVK